MICRTFFQFTQTGENVSSSNPQDLSSAQVWAELVDHLVDEDDYVGLLDRDDNVLQISRESAAAPFRLELVLPDTRASLVGNLSAEELKDLLERLPARFKESGFPGLSHQQWSADTE